MSTKFVDTSFGGDFCQHYTVSEEVFTVVETKGHEPDFITLTQNLQTGVIQVNIRCSKCKGLFNPDSRIKQCSYQRPSPKLRKALRPKGKK